MAFDAFAGRGARLEIELRDPDGGHIVTLERVWGESARTQMDPASLLAIIVRKLRMWGGCLIVCVWDHLIERKRSW